MNDCMQVTLEATNIPACDICGKEQTTLGALEFGIPFKIPGKDGMYCEKVHVCVSCHAARKKEWAILSAFTKEEQLTILEVVREALTNNYEYVADHLDMSDEEIKALQEKINKIM